MVDNLFVIVERIVNDLEIIVDGNEEEIQMYFDYNSYNCVKGIFDFKKSN